VGNLREGLGKKTHPQAVERVWGWTPKFSNFYNAFQELRIYGILWFKISDENHVFKLLQSVLVCPSL